MSLNSLASLIKNRSTLLLGLLFVLMMVGLIFFLTRTNPENSDQASLLKLPVIDFPQFDGIKLESSSLTQININQDSSRKTMTVFSMNAQIEEQAAKNIGKEIGFSSEPQVFNDQIVGKALFWQKGLETLGINLDRGTVDYQLQVTPDSKIVSSKALSKAEALISAKDFLASKTFIKGDLKEREELTSFYYGNESILQPAKEEQANLVKIYFSESVQDNSLVSSFGGTIEIIVGTGGKIIEAHYLYPGKLEVLNSYPLRTLKQATEDIKANKGTVVYQEYFGSAEGLQTIRPLREVMLDKYSINYYISGGEQSYLEPIYVFEGTYASDKGERWRIRIYLPAIEEKYLINSSNSIH